MDISSIVKYSPLHISIRISEHRIDKEISVLVSTGGLNGVGISHAHNRPVFLYDLWKEGAIDLLQRDIQETLDVVLTKIDEQEEQDEVQVFGVPLTPDEAVRFFDQVAEEG